MDVREKLVELMDASRQYVINTCQKNHFECDNCVGKVYDNECGEFLKADYLLANGVTVQEWVSVEDRLPEDSVAVNLHTRSGVVGTGFYNKYTKSWVQWYSGGSLCVDVTHWMPLPQPPKGE